MVKNRFEAVIGLEVHVQLQTASKIFSSSSTQFGAAPNIQVDPVCLGLPGVLPVLNKTAVEFALRMGLATGCEIATKSTFARKHYFYPDLPRGYQISQFSQPLCQNGVIAVEFARGKKRKVRIVRIHLEEDAGKSIHAEGEAMTLIDLNRCGVPLIEIVSGPDLRAPAEAAAFLVQIRQLVRYLKISNGNMEEGSLRCDANVSIRQVGSEALGTKTELKNMNSISGVENALHFEILRQIEIVQRGGNIEQQTLWWDADRNRTVPMRSKEQSHDYRYLPEPDLPPLIIDAGWLKAVRAALPELPKQRRDRFIEQYGLPEYDASLLCSEKALADFFEEVAAGVKNPKNASNWIMGEILRILNELKVEITACPVQPDRLAALIVLVENDEISNKSAKMVFDEMVTCAHTPEQIVDAKGWRQMSDEASLLKLIDTLLAKCPDEVQRFRDGEHKLMSFFVGQVMRETRGRANPTIVTKLLKQRLPDS